MTRTAGAQIGCQRPSRFWGLGCPKIYHEAEDTLVPDLSAVKVLRKLKQKHPALAVSDRTARRYIRDLKETVTL
ncbi:hypothetical protein, partial [Thiolapillus sp.]|uniref:hypothetical protein n=1 Tax=Thiolapillus sp. TaxID=2017437 RepID=UPI003AF959ED